jgi:predicted kinase
MRFIDLQEGPNDPGIFKAIFLAGGPGSGKGYVAQQLGLQARGLKVINSDDAFEYLMRKRKLSFDMPPQEQPDRDVARQRAKDLTNKRQDIYLDGRLGIIIDGTAKDPNKMAKLKTELEAIGYQTMMVFVNTSLRTALQRNLLRDRKVPTDIVTQSHKQVQTNKDTLSDVFAPNYVEVNNDDNANFNEPLKRVEKFIDAPVTAQARDWISKASVQKSIAQEDVQSKPKVYVDMDGVIANFYAGMSKLTGHPEPRAMQDLESEVRKLAGTDFFYQLPKYEQAEELLGYINKMTGGDWYILSSPLSNDKEASAAYKKAWIRDKLDHKPRGAYFTGQKEQYATQADGTPNILIDDYPGYLKKWREKGGIGVQYKGHVGNIEDVKATLDQHFGNTKPVEEAKESIKDQIEKAYIQDGGSIDEYFVRSANVDKLGYSAKQTFGRSPDIGDDNFSVDYIGYGKGKPALWFYPLAYYLKSVADVAYGNDMPHVWLVRIKSNAWLQPVSNNKVTKQDAPTGKERVGLLRKSAVPAAIFFKPAFDVVDKFYDHGSQHKRHGEVKGVPETIRKVKGGYRLLSKKGKNLGTYPSKSGAENREREVQYFKHMGEAGRSTAVEPDPSGYQHSLLTAPQNTLVIDKSDDMDFYKLGQHYTSLANYDKHELGVGPSDMTITFASPEEMERMKGVFDKLGVVYKDISGSHEEPEIHTKPPEGNVAEALDSSYEYRGSKRNPGNDFYFDTEDGQEYKVEIDNVDNDVTVAFSARGQGDEHKIGLTGTGNSRKIFGTVIKIVKDYIRKSNPEIIAFSANNSEPSRVRLYKMLASQANKELSNYNFTDAFSNGGLTTYYLTRDGAKIPTSTKVKAKAGKALDKVFNSQQPKLSGRLFTALSEVADSPYDFVRNVKTPDKRAYRFQTDAGLMYRVQVFNRRKDDANKLEIHFDLTDMNTGKPETGVTGTGDAVRVFSTVANILKQEVSEQDPTGVVIASKADDESRVKLYRTLARRATKLMPGYEITRERQVTGGDGNPYLTIELAKK